MKVYICKIEVLGMPFCTADKERADDFKNQDSTHYYEEFEVEDL